jgi:5'/3'-nucleotidase
MKFLLSNDDGILAPGLAAMYRALRTRGDVVVAAPDSVQSAMGHAITINKAVAVRRVHVNNDFHGFSISGRPADCVKLAVSQLLDDPPDVVVSGINDGANVGINVFYSGTVAAAAEGALLGFPAVAVSLERGPEMNFDRAAAIAIDVIQTLLVGSLSPGQLVSINIPELHDGLPKGVRVAVQAKHGMRDAYDVQDLGDGVRQYSLFGEYLPLEPGHETDLHALNEGYVVVTPLRIDMTDHQRLVQLESLDWPPMTIRSHD